MASTSKSVALASPIKPQTKGIIFNIYEYLRNIKEQHCLDINLLESIRDATGISRSAVARIVREGKRSETEFGMVKFASPKRAKGERQKRIEVEEEFPESVVRRKILEFYAVRKECPTLDKLLLSLKDEEDILNCSREYLRRQIQKVGFSWKKCHSSRKLLLEKPEISAWRWRYLTRMREFRRANKNIVYLDETYVLPSHTVQHCWQTVDMAGPIPLPNGPRLIIVNAGGESGFVPNALLLYISNVNRGDYHGDMNEENFNHWLQQQLIPNLPPESVVVLDNAAYHNAQRVKKPSTTSLKSEIIDWLVKKGIPCSAEMRKHELLQLCQLVTVEKSYFIDEMLTAYGHEVLRLPPHHPDLNPIELVWRRIRSRIAVECPSTNLNDKKEFCLKIFNEYSTVQWAQCCAYVKKVEEIYWKRDSIIDSVIDQLIINIGGSGHSTDEEWDEDEN